jgi:hypothetical protein
VGEYGSWERFSIQGPGPYDDIAMLSLCRLPVPLIDILTRTGERAYHRHLVGFLEGVQASAHLKSNLLIHQEKVGHAKNS